MRSSIEWARFAQDGLRDLGRQRLRKALHQAREGRVVLQLGEELLARHAQELAPYLDQRLHVAALGAKRRGGAGHAFIAHHADFDAGAALAGEDQGDHAVERKVDRVDGAARRVQHRLDFQAEFLAAPGDALRIRRGQQREDQVGAVLMRARLPADCAAGPTSDCSFCP
jgi:hypothetical protein